MVTSKVSSERKLSKKSAKLSVKNFFRENVLENINFPQNCKSFRFFSDFRNFFFLDQNAKNAKISQNDLLANRTQEYKMTLRLKI